MAACDPSIPHLYTPVAWAGELGRILHASLLLYLLLSLSLKFSADGSRDLQLLAIVSTVLCRQFFLCSIASLGTGWWKHSQRYNGYPCKQLTWLYIVKARSPSYQLLHIVRKRKLLMSKNLFHCEYWANMLSSVYVWSRSFWWALIRIPVCRCQRGVEDTIVEEGGSITFVNPPPPPDSPLPILPTGHAGGSTLNCCRASMARSEKNHESHCSAIIRVGNVLLWGWAYQQGIHVH